MTPDPGWLSARGGDAVLLQCAATAFDPGDAPVAVAVSGGGDSMALLHLMARLAAHAGRPLAAVTVNHGLRPEAADEARTVADTCAALGVAHRILNWSGPGDSGNLMAMARQARYGLMADWARAAGVARIALGHTADDQAETFLMRLGRRSGVDGLSAMARRFDVRGVTFCRPLLLQKRDDLRAYLGRHGLSWCEDPTNADPSFERTRARRALAVLADLGLDADTFSAVSAHMHSARAALRAATAEAADRIVTQDRGDLILDRRPFLALPFEIQRRLVQGALRWISGAHYPDRAVAQNRLIADIRAGTTATLGGCLATPGPDTWRMTREWAAVRDTRCAVSEVWDGRWHLAGPELAAGEIRALGEAGLRACPDWRDTGLPRASLAASPSVWEGDTLIAAPLAGMANGWAAELTAESTGGRGDFAAFLLSH